MTDPEILFSDFNEKKLDGTEISSFPAGSISESQESKDAITESVDKGE